MIMNQLIASKKKLSHRLFVLRLSVTCVIFLSLVIAITSFIYQDLKYPHPDSSDVDKIGRI